MNLTKRTKHERRQWALLRAYFSENPIITVGNYQDFAEKHPDLVWGFARGDRKCPNFTALRAYRTQLTKEGVLSR